MALPCSRRDFLWGGMAASAWAFARPWRALAADVAVANEGYGPLRPVRDATTGLPLLQLPDGFRYVSMGWVDQAMDDGQPTPPGHDGAAVFAAPNGMLHYVRNHELRYKSSSRFQRSFAPAAATYDDGQAPGGTTTLVFDPHQEHVVRVFPSLSGTIRNCAGGPTPWGTWLTCEETVDGPGNARDDADLNKTHGWVFEVPADGLGSPQPITGLGRYNHEAVAVDPSTGMVYATEDSSRSGIYRFQPSAFGELHGGGTLSMLAVRGERRLNTSRDVSAGDWLPIDWVPIQDPARAHDSDDDGRGVFTQGYEQGGARFVRGEGMWYGGGRIYFTATDAGAAGKGQVWELDPQGERLRLLFESPGAHVLENPDNITVSPRGGLILCEDGDREGLYLRGMTAAGGIFDFARNNVVLDGEVSGLRGDFRDGEWAGAAFSPDGNWLFANIQSPGITFAITGPWARGVL